MWELPIAAFEYLYEDTTKMSPYQLSAVADRFMSTYEIQNYRYRR